MQTFVDCPNCGKRVRANARRCHHCGSALDCTDGAQEDSEHAQGGYDESQDDFDYDEYLENEFGSGDKNKLSKLWRYTAWVLLFAVLVPIAMSVMALMLS
ncbi:MAG: zinc ribbon domain-containing protein [Pirellulales bacterium]